MLDIADQSAGALDAQRGRAPWTRREIRDRRGLTEFPTFDRVDGKARQVPVYVYEPASPGPHPVLLVLHGGPESQFRPGFDPWLQYLVNELGFAVIAPNVRGSSGYGKTYQALDNGVLREDAVKDVGAIVGVA